MLNAAASGQTRDESKVAVNAKPDAPIDLKRVGVTIHDLGVREGQHDRVGGREQTKGTAVGRHARGAGPVRLVAEHVRGAPS